MGTTPKTVAVFLKRKLEPIAWGFQCVCNVRWFSRYRTGTTAKIWCGAAVMLDGFQYADCFVYIYKFMQI